MEYKIHCYQCDTVNNLKHNLDCETCGGTLVFNGAIASTPLHQMDDKYIDKLKEGKNLDCSCQGFFQPIDCPAHGQNRKTEITNRHNAIKAMNLVSDHLTEEASVFEELKKLRLSETFLTQLNSDISVVLVKLETVQMNKLKDIR